MHELGIASEIYRVCRDSIAEHGSGRLETVRIVIGELSAVEPDQLTFAWEAVTHDGPDRKARLEIEWRAASQHCVACDEDAPRSPGEWIPVCPQCDGPLVVRGGDELDIVNMTVIMDDN